MIKYIRNTNSQISAFESVDCVVYGLLLAVVRAIIILFMKRPYTV